MHSDVNSKSIPRLNLLSQASGGPFDGSTNGRSLRSYSSNVLILPAEQSICFPQNGQMAVHGSRDGRSAVKPKANNLILVTLLGSFGTGEDGWLPSLQKTP